MLYWSQREIKASNSLHKTQYNKKEYNHNRRGLSKGKVSMGWVQGPAIKMYKNKKLYSTKTGQYLQR